MSNNIIHPDAKIGVKTTIGPFCVIGQNVIIGENCKIHSHVIIQGNTSIGSHCEIFSFASIGSAPQDLKYKGEKNFLIIGKNNKIREYVTINPGTKGGGGKTSIGDNCLLMVGTHIAHDCIVGDNVIFANNATLAGHVHIQNNAILGGLSAVHQFVRIGEGSMIGGMSGVVSDVIPYGSVVGNRAKLAGLNLIGLKRSNIKTDEMKHLRQFYKLLFYSNRKNFKERIKDLSVDFRKIETTRKILDFLEQNTSRSICLPDNE